MEKDSSKKINIALLFSILSIIFSVITLIWGEGIYVNYKENQEQQLREQQALESEYLKIAEDYNALGDYEKVASVFSKDILKDNPYALLNIGVMYANGQYYVANENIAKDYFYKALEAGEEYYSIIYLLSILDASEGKDGKEELNRLFIKGCNNNNQHCEKLLQYLYLISDIDIETSCLKDFNSKSQNEKEELLAGFYREIGTYKQWTAKSYNYYINEQTGEVTAEADEIIEKEYKVIVKPLFNHEYEMQFN